MQRVSEGLDIPAEVVPARSPGLEYDSKLNISVVFTNVAATLAALKSAGELACSLDCSITLVAPLVVPYPLPIDSPPVMLDWNRTRIEAISSESPVETSVRILLCRDRATALSAALKPHSIVFVGGRKRWWWPSAEERLSRTLRRAGHDVVFAGTE